MGILDTLVKTTAKKTLIKTAGDVAVKTAVSVMDYKNNHPNASVFITAPTSAEDYVGQNVENVREELSAYGFVNIALLEKKDLIKGWLTKVGTVEEVSINGKTNFKKKTKFRPDDRVVIVYHTFRN
jgi:hypothetical protein